MFKIELPNHIWSTKLDGIDNAILTQSCLQVETFLRQKLQLPFWDEGYEYGCVTSYYHKEYNLFHFPCLQLHKLYTKLLKTFIPILPNNTFYIRSWVNLFKQNKNIEWHDHGYPSENFWHGFYCVNVEDENPSFTEYRNTSTNEFKSIQSYNSLCVIGKSKNNFEHRSTKWLNPGIRITIAFDLIPLEVLRPQENYTHELLNNYIPFTKEVICAE